MSYRRPVAALNRKGEQSKLRDVLEKLYKKYNHRKFIPPDPLVQLRTLQAVFGLDPQE
jgi:DNA-binding SARP family transcriptional activator